MHRYGQHPVVAVKGLLYPVAVVRVHVHVSHPHPAPQEVVNCQRRVVEHAEPRSVPGGCVVQPSGDVEGAVHRPPGHQFGGQQRRPGAESGRFVHSGIIRVVALQAEVEALGLVDALSGAQPSHCRNVFRRMQPQQFIFGGRARSHQYGVPVVKSAISLQEFVGIAQPHRAHGVVAPQFVARHPVVIDKGGLGHGVSPRSECRDFSDSVAYTRPACLTTPAPLATRNSAKFVSQKGAESGASGYIRWRSGGGRCFILSALVGSYRAESPDFGPSCPKKALRG